MAFFDSSLPASRPLRTQGLFDLARRIGELHRQRLALKRLSDDALRDIGLTRAQADQEAQKPVWDVPQNWRR